MLLIGLFALVLMLVPGEAQAAPIFVPIFLAVGMSAFWAGVASFVLTTVLTMAISFAVSSLLKPASSARGQTFPGTSQPVIDNKINVRQPTAPRQVIYGEARVGGVFGFMHATNSNKFLHLIVLCAGHEVHQFAQVWIGDEAFVAHENAGSAAPGDLVIDANGFVPSPSQFAGKLRVRPFKGAPGQVIDADLLAECSDVLTDADTFAGMAGVYIRLEFDQAIFRDIPNITCVIKGKNDVYDPRTDTTGWSVNSALIVASYLCDPVYGIGVDYAGGIVESALIASANGCDEQVELAGGGMESRFETYGSFKSSDKPREILGRLLGAMHGRAPYDGERWRILAGIYQSPTITITESDLRAGPTVQTLVSRRDRFNAVKGTYINPATFWQEADFPPIVSESYAILDGEPIYSDIVLPFTRAASMAQRIAKISLLLSRQEFSVTLPGKLSLWRHLAGDTAWFNYPRYGWTAKPFEVRDVTLALDAENRLACDLTLAATSPEVYDWATSEEVPVDPNPGTGGPDPNTVAPPTNLTVTEEVYETAPGQGVKSRLLIDWDPSPDGFLLAYQVEMKPQSVTDWDATHILGRTATTETHWTVDDVAVGYYHVRVAAINHLEKRSTFIQESVTVSGDTAPPEDVTGFTQTAGVSGFTTFEWDAAVDERARNGTVEIRFQAVTTGATWGDATTVFTGAGTTTNAVLLTEIGTYLIKFRSATGVYSTDAATVVITTKEQPQVGVEIVDTLPATDLYDGRMVYLTTDGKLYRYDETLGAWTAAVPAEDITGQITDDQIADMDAAKLTGEITGTQIADDSISTPKLQAGAVVTAKLAAQAVTAEKILIADFTNFVVNYSFSLGTGGWATVANSGVTSGNGYNGSGYHLAISTGFSTGIIQNENVFTVTPGQVYVLKAVVQRLSTPNVGISVKLKFMDASNAEVSGAGNVLTWTSASSSSYTEKVTTSANIVVPATATQAVVQIYKSSGSNLSGGTYRVGSVSVLKKGGGEVIVDGSILAANIATNAITADKITAGAVTAAKLSVSTLSAIAADMGSLTAGTVTGAILRTSSGNTRIEMRGDGLFPNAITPYVNIGGVSTPVATFGGDITTGLGVLQIAGNLPISYPIRAVNESTTGGGGGDGGGAAKLQSTGGWTLEVTQTTAGAGSPSPNTAIRGASSTGGTADIGRSSGAGSWSVYAVSGAGYGPFTGAHDGLLPVAVAPEVGDLLVDDAVVAKSISDVLCTMTLSASANQAGVLGVFVNRYAPIAEWAPAAMTEADGITPVAEWVYYLASHDLVVINAVGEGSVNVCGQGGDIAKGDLLCASDLPGKAMKQADNIVRSTSVARAREDMTFAAPEEVKQIACVYGCG
ncbi:hypothetical protein [Reyranella sp.]|jgi:hypothetical protein|uniref:hypothetical protein n=2 Tax=Reyranella sp. TaxID=1929291 RepID=UPI002C685B01|nr:hypothetical protein [Reyranella sp.]HQS18597.1 hypothetical protein [Reyranella sp.]HQT14815.1 hypothetical protein [Reyranella sp.]